MSKLQAPRGRLFLFTLISVLLLETGTVQAKVYKWVDAQGQVHYSQTPPPKAIVTAKDSEVMTGLSRKYFPREKDGETYCAGEKLYRIKSYDVENTIYFLIEEKDRFEQLVGAESDTERRDVLRCKAQYYTNELQQHSNRIDQIRREYETLEKRRVAMEKSKDGCYSDKDKTLYVGEEARDMVQCLDRYDSLNEIEQRLRDLKKVYFAIKEKLDG